MKESNKTELKKMRQQLRKMAESLERIHDDEGCYYDVQSLEDILGKETDEEFNKRIKILNIADCLNKVADMLSWVISDRTNTNI